MEYLADTHVHSIYSYDGQMRLESMIKRGIELGLRYMAFTEHVEFGQITLKQFLNRFAIYSEEINELQLKYPNIKLLKGAEISNPEKYPSELSKLNELDLDFIIGSNHIMPNTGSELDILEYYKCILSIVKQGGVDALGHLDYLRRKYDDSLVNYSIIYTIFEEMLKNNITLEINSSAIRRKNLDSFPSKDKLDIYKSLGGRNITIGSDAHRINEIYDNIPKIASENTCFNQGIYEKRMFKTLNK